MTLQDFLDNCNKFSVPPLGSGKAKDIKELHENLIKPTLPKQEVIEKWHELLIKYCNQEDAVFFIRRYASAPKKDWTLIRRGFLTEYESGLKYVFCDNYFAHYFYLMSLTSFVPTLEELNNSIKNRNFPYGYMITSAEEPYQAYPKGKVVNINSAGWKLAHLFSVNQNDYNFDYKAECKKLFPRGFQEDWNSHPEKQFPVRTIKKKHSEDLRKKTIAHFLRLVHPINYFLVPKVRLSNLNIGEYPEVLSFMRKKASDRFGLLFEEYKKLILASDVEFKNNTTSTFDFQYGSTASSLKSSPLSTKPRKKRKVQQVPHSSTELIYSDLHLEMLKAYLMENKSFRTIEIEIMGLESPVRGGGFKAKRIINDYGAQHENKGTVTKSNITEVITRNEGQLKQSLMKLRNYLFSEF